MAVLPCFTDFSRGPESGFGIENRFDIWVNPFEKQKKDRDKASKYFKMYKWWIKRID